ncbi:fungal specific transcription factor [Apiospora arundinis]
MEHYFDPPYNPYENCDVESNFNFPFAILEMNSDENMNGYLPQEYPHDQYPSHQHFNATDPKADMLNANVELGFDRFPYIDPGVVPSVPSPSPTAPSSGITTAGTPSDLTGGFNSPPAQGHVIGARLGQWPSERFVPRDNNWTYGIRVRPATDEPDSGLQPSYIRLRADCLLRDGTGRRDVEHHRNALHEALLSKGIRYTTHDFLNDPEPHRLYRLHDKLRDSEKARLEFMQVFSANRPYNQRLKQYQFNMSVVGYEPRDFGLGSSYPNISDPSGNGGINSPFEDDPVSGLPLLPDSPSHHHFGSLPATSPQPVLSGPKSDSDQQIDTPAPQRTKAIPKPDREVVKNVNGKYVCIFPDCTEEVREFGRKCEWSKHMDKHDRPYKCAVDGCEKLPGFTYSGGLLRHEREVHGKHGGPKNPLNCPHPNCKRYSGKGFSRLENLNEHLRRVHTNGASSGDMAADDHESIATTMEAAEHVSVGEKRKADDEDLRVEVKKLHVENGDLRAKLDAQERQFEALQEQMRQLQDTLSSLQQTRMSSAAVSMLDDPTSTF